MRTAAGADIGALDTDPLSTEKGSTLDAHMAGRPNPLAHRRSPSKGWSIYGAKRAQPVAKGRKWEGSETEAGLMHLEPPGSERSYRAPVPRLAARSKANWSTRLWEGRFARERGHSPTDLAAMKCSCLAVRGLDRPAAADALDIDMESHPQRLRDQVRRLDQFERQLTMPTASNGSSNRPHLRRPRDSSATSPKRLRPCADRPDVVL
jgi:hypothetical protein